MTVPTTRRTMNRRSTPQAKIDDTAFPVRLLALVPQVHRNSIHIRLSVLRSVSDAKLPSGF
jgi:hypothetical protein